MAFDEWYEPLDAEAKQVAPDLPSKTESFFKSDAEIQRLRSRDLTQFLNDSLDAGRTHPGLAQSLRGFLLSGVGMKKQEPASEDGKVRFGAVETIPLRHMASLNTTIMARLYMRVHGVDFDTGAPSSCWRRWRVPRR